MKTGKSILELAQEIERQRESRRDYLANTRDLAMDPAPGGDVLVDLGTHGPVQVNNLAHRQLGEHVGIPAKYYDRMRQDAPELLAANVNHWFASEAAPRLVRCLDGRMRAFLSDRYRSLENSDLAEAVLPIFADKGLEVVSCELTERRLYLKAVDMRIVREIEGRRIVDGRAVAYDHLSPSLTVSNSEVGSGALSVELGAYTHECRNMAMFRERSLKKHHVGGRLEALDGIVAMLSEQTQRATDKAIWLQVRDVVAGALNEDRFDAQVKEIRGMKAQAIGGDPIKAIDLAARTFDIGEGEKRSVLRHLIEGGDLSRYGLFNAITRTAEDLGDYDRATDFERMGGQLIELPSNDWKRIAEAA
jgi:hypothetical protein